MRDMRVKKTFERIYQYKDGTYLLDSSQPDPKNDYEIVCQEYTPHESTRYVNIITNNDVDSSAIRKELPDIYIKREECCGCTACWAICPVNAIEMRTDEEGFLYPVVDAAKCIRCYKCLSVCAFKSFQLERKNLHSI